MATGTEAPPPRAAVVVDCSVCLPWFLIDERSLLADRILETADELELWAPTVWRLELANALNMAFRRRRLASRSWREAIQEAARAPVQIDPTIVSLDGIAELAERHGLTTYDACYLELALRRDMLLATEDSDLRRAAEEAGARLFG